MFSVPGRMLPLFFTRDHTSTLAQVLDVTHNSPVPSTIPGTLAEGESADHARNEMVYRFSPCRII